MTNETLGLIIGGKKKSFSQVHKESSSDQNSTNLRKICITYPLGFNIKVRVNKGTAEVDLDHGIVYIHIRRGFFNFKHGPLELEVKFTRSTEFSQSDWKDTLGDFITDENGPDKIIIRLDNNKVDVTFQVNQNQFIIETKNYVDNICFLTFMPGYQKKV